MPTSHINAKIGDFSESIIMPGDPLRAKYIADTFFTNVKQVNNVRNMLAYTGNYKGNLISVMGHGMGIPSCSIYIKELITDFGVKKIIRVGSCGAIKNDVCIRDIIIAMGASTDSNVNRIRFKNHDFAAIADYNLLHNAVNIAKSFDIPIRVGNIFSSDFFYTPENDIFDILDKYNILGIEMEAAGVYGVAAEFGARALTICTVSDHIRTGEKLNAYERETTFNNMIKIAIESIILLD